MTLLLLTISAVTPKIVPVILLIKINAITAANAPPARSLAQLPPIAAANKICRLLITAQPICSITEPTVITNATSAPNIWNTLPNEIIKPAAGITAITVIKALPNFCKKSKLIPFFFFFSGAALGAATSSRTSISSFTL